MTQYDPKLPIKLQLTQEWFGSIISRPINLQSRMHPISPRGRPMEEEACDYILPSPTLQPAQRIELYNQQYWWRLLSTLHENFPFLTRLFGYEDFNRSIGIPYLDKYPPNTWTLNALGNRLIQWLDEEYQASDADLVKGAAAIDLAFSQAFVAGTKPVPADISDLTENKIFLQPFVYLFKLKSQLFEFRREMLKENPEYWVENDFPSLKHEQSYHMLRRSVTNHIVVDSLEPAAYEILMQFRQGATLDEVCEWLELQDSSISEAASNNLHLWFQEWILKQCLTVADAQDNECERSSLSSPLGIPS